MSEWKEGKTLKVVYYRNIKKVYDEDDSLVSRDCSKCKKHLEKSEFPKTKSVSYVDGIKGKCNECTKEYFDEYEVANREGLLEYRKGYYKENKEEVNRKNKENHLKNKDAIAVYQRQWREENKDSLKEYYKNWSNENRDSLNEYKSLFTSKRRTILKKLPSNLTKEDWMSIKSSFNYECALSNSTNITIEHFIPSSIGHGGTTIFNCYPIDADLNSSKNKKNPFEWAKEQISKGNIETNKWNSLVLYLANMNGLSVSNFESFVYWCFNNKRKSAEILDDIPSLDLWLEKEGEKHCDL